jgi:sialic acid synthase SpsE
MPLETPAIRIGGRRVATDLPPFVIAEIGLNPGGSLDSALELIEAAAVSGAHAVKLQTLQAEALVAPSCPAPAHVEAESLVEFFERFELDADAHRAVVTRARERGLKVMSTALSEGAVDLLDELGVDAIKIASGDLTWDQLIVRAARTGRPLVLSTGMSTLGEVRHALALARDAGASEVALLHCVSAYPVPGGSENLLAIRTLADECGVPVGLSDHAPDTFSLPLAVALGASLYVRHLVLEGDADAVDRAVSSTASELQAAIEASRRAWLALGTGRKACLEAEAPNLQSSRRSLCAARDLPAGTVLAASDLVALRPGTGLPPSSLATVCGLTLARAVGRGEPLSTDIGCADAKGTASRVA